MELSGSVERWQKCPKRPKFFKFLHSHLVCHLKKPLHAVSAALTTGNLLPSEHSITASSSSLSSLSSTTIPLSTTLTLSRSHSGTRVEDMLGSAAVHLGTRQVTQVALRDSKTFWQQPTYHLQARSAQHQRLFSCTLEKVLCSGNAHFLDRGNRDNMQRWMIEYIKRK